MGVMGFPPTLCNLENRRGICLENPKFCLVFVCFGHVVVFLMYYEEWPLLVTSFYSTKFVSDVDKQMDGQAYWQTDRLVSWNSIVDMITQYFTKECWGS